MVFLLNLDLRNSVYLPNFLRFHLGLNQIPIHPTPTNGIISNLLIIFFLFFQVHQHIQAFAKSLHRIDYRIYHEYHQYPSVMLL